MKRRDRLVTYWKSSYLIIVLIYVSILAGMMSLALLGMIEVPGEQGVSLLIAGLALLISLIQMAESNKKRRTISVDAKIWGYKRGKFIYATLKYENLLDMPLDDFRFKLKLPRRLLSIKKGDCSDLQCRSYGKTDVISCEDVDFLGAKNSYSGTESISLRFDTSKFPNQKRIATLTLSAQDLAPVRLKLTTEQLNALCGGAFRNETVATKFFTS